MIGKKNKVYWRWGGGGGNGLDYDKLVHAFELNQNITIISEYFHKIVEAQVLITTLSKRLISLLHTCFGKTHAIFSTNDNRLFSSDIYM